MRHFMTLLMSLLVFAVAAGEAAHSQPSTAVKCGAAWHSAMDVGTGCVNASVGAEYVSGEGVGLGINADLLDGTSDVWVGIAYHASFGKVEIAPTVGIGWGHHFTQKATDHNYHTYRVGLSFVYCLCESVGMELMPMAWARDWQGHLLKSWRPEVAIRLTYKLK